MMKKSRLIKLFLINLFLFVLSATAFSQDILKSKDLTQLKIDEISNADFLKIKAQVNSAGFTPEQVEQMAIGKGLPINEAAKLKNRLSGNAMNAANSSKPLAENPSTSREQPNNELLEKNKENKGAPIINPLIFGSELYSNSSLNFEPNLKLATPTNYVLGPDDEIQISIYGIQEYYGTHTLSPEGVVTVPNVGQIKLAGLTIEAATQKLKYVLGNSVYSYLKTGGSKLTLTLSKIKTISITIIGSNKPGNYKVSSFSSVFNALFAAGGPTNNGSFREIELIRENKVLKKIDLYRFLIKGDQSDNIGLKDNDVIRIPVFKNRIEIQGQVKRPGYFELLEGETFSQALEYASGFTDSAYKASIKVLRRGDKERELHDLTINEYSRFNPRAGDLFQVSKTLNKFQNRVIISGAVYKPDAYELIPSMRVADLIRVSDGLKQDAFTERGQIIRYQEDLTKSILSFNIRNALMGIDSDNIQLKREDKIVISSVLDLKEKFKVKIQGEIRKPGEYDFVENLSLKDLILQSGGLTDAAYQQIEIARLIKRDSLELNDLRISAVQNVIINRENFGEKTNNINLMPFDVITIRRLAGYKPPVSVIVSGQVQHAGPYSLISTNERVSELIKRTGGFTPDAYPEGAYVKRVKTSQEKEIAMENLKKLQKNTNDTSSKSTNDILREYDKIPLNFKEIQKNPSSNEDIYLKENDELVIPKFDAQVKITGEVLLSTQLPYDKSRKLKQYINSAGGFTSNALRSKVYVVYSNGVAASTKSFLFIKSYPKIEPGSELIVPKRKEKKGTSIAEIAGFATVLASLVTTFVLLKK